jgi:hypothetical protein
MTYFHEIIVTTILMIWCFVLLDPILFSINYNKDTITQMLFVGLCVIVLYVFELIYRHEMRWQLLLHHLVRHQTNKTVHPPAKPFPSLQLRRFALCFR